MEGVDSGDDFGMHTLVSGEKGEIRVSGTQIKNGGQKNILGRYPFHFHLMGDGENSEKSYFEDNTILNSHFRCISIHGTSKTRISRNVAYNIKGHCFFLEDGVEEMNTIEYNLASHVHPILLPARGGFHGEEVEENAENLLIPSDVAASGFYMAQKLAFLIILRKASVYGRSFSQARVYKSQNFCAI